MLAPYLFLIFDISLSYAHTPTHTALHTFPCCEVASLSLCSHWALSWLNLSSSSSFSLPQFLSPIWSWLVHRSVTMEEEVNIRVGGNKMGVRCTLSEYGGFKIELFKLAILRLWALMLLQFSVRLQPNLIHAHIYKHNYLFSKVHHSCIWVGQEVLVFFTLPLQRHLQV